MNNDAHPNSVVKTRVVQPGLVEARMDDAEHRNRLSAALCEELAALLSLLAEDASVKVLLLRGRPDVFCAGATREVLAGIADGKIDVRDIDLASRMLAFPLPIVAALEGHAVGGGLTLAMCCDITIAAESRRYGANFASMGFTPALGTTALLPALVGHGLASEMMLTAKFYKGRELAGCGLFTHVVRATEVYPRALDIARSIAEKERLVVEMIKDTLAVPRRMMLQQAISREHLMHRISFSRPETQQITEQNYLDG